MMLDVTTAAPVERATQPTWTGFVRYRATISSNWTGQAAEAGLRWVF